MTTSAHNESLFSMDELQMNGNAHLAFQDKHSPSVPQLRFREMIGDRTARLHVGPGHYLALDREYLDIPFSTHVYLNGHAKLARHTLMDNIKVSALYLNVHSI